MRHAVILILEDERSIADNQIYALENDGHCVIWRETGHDGLATLAAHHVDLVLLDIGLPDVNGFELCRQIREDYDVPIIFVTARDEQVDRVVGLELGGDDYIVKPYYVRELTARVRAVLRRTQRPETTKPTTEFPFSVDTNKGQITYFGQVLPLSRYEFRLLEIFINHPGWIYSREQLMRMAWEEPDMSLERTVDTHIKTLRAKLRAVHSDGDVIITHRNAGYALKDVW